jgi:hypothetical protein
MPQDHRDGRKGGRTALLKHAARSTALAALAVCAGTVLAHAGDDDIISTGTSFYDTVLQTIGLQGGPNIQYSERSPLVVPPTRDLPPPAADRAPAVPNWPVDPDMTRQAKAKVKEKPKPHPDYVIESSRALSPAELNVPGAAASSSGRRDARADPEAQDLSPAATQPNKKSLFSFDLFNGNKTEYATFTGEPARTSLTDPPPGYMTPSPDEPYGVGPEQRKYKVPTVADRVTPSSGSAAGN